MFRKEFIFNSLTIRIFTFFWLTFSILLIFIFLLPYFDAHIYSNLKEYEVAKYQKEIWPVCLYFQMIDLAHIRF